jgi:hypothetical protein
MTGDRGFWDSKLNAPTPVPASETNGYVGHWTTNDPNSMNVDLQIRADGGAVATDGNDRYEGRWRLFGTQIIITVEDEVLTGELQPNGRLLLGEPGSESDHVTFRKAP